MTTAAPLFIQEPMFYLLAIPALLIVGISKGGLGGGLGVAGVPLLSLAVEPATAAAVLLPLLCCMDLMGLRAYKGQYHRGNMRILLPAAAVGIGIGVLVFRYLSTPTLRLIIGVVAVGFTLFYWLGGREQRPPRTVSKLRGGFWGTVAGFTSFVAHAGGPPLSVYLLPQRLHKTLFVGTTVVFFTLINYMKLVPYVWLGQLNRQVLMTALVLSPLAFVGIGLGVWLHTRINETLFYRICYIFLAVTGLKLMWDGLAPLRFS